MAAVLAQGEEPPGEAETARLDGLAQAGSFAGAWAEITALCRE